MKLKIAETAVIRLTGTVGKGFFLLLPIVIRKYAYLSYTAEASADACTLIPNFREFTGGSFMPEIEIAVTRDKDTSTLYLTGRPVESARVFLQFFFGFLFLFTAIILAVWIFAGPDLLALIVPLIMGTYAYALSRLSTKKMFRKVTLAIEQGFPEKFIEHIEEEKSFMTKQEIFLNALFDNGLVDERKMAVVANAKSLPGGEFGLCLLCLKGSVLSVYDTDFKQNVGPLMYEIELKRASALKTSSFIFNRYLKFTYNSFPYKFVDFGNAKAFIAAVSAEVGA